MERAVQIYMDLLQSLASDTISLGNQIARLSYYSGEGCVDPRVERCLEEQVSVERGQRRAVFHRGPVNQDNITGTLCLVCTEHSSKSRVVSPFLFPEFAMLLGQSAGKIMGFIVKKESFTVMRVKEKWAD